MIFYTPEERQRRRAEERVKTLPLCCPRIAQKAMAAGYRAASHSPRVCPARYRPLSRCGDEP